MEKTTNDAGALKINYKDEQKNDEKSNNYEEGTFDEITLTNLEELGAFTGFNFPDVPAWNPSNIHDDNNTSHESYIGNEISGATNERQGAQDRAHPKFTINSPLAHYYSSENTSPGIIQNNLQLGSARPVQNIAQVTNLPPVAHPDKIRPPTQKSTIKLARERKSNIYII